MQGQRGGSQVEILFLAMIIVMIVMIAFPSIVRVRAEEDFPKIFDGAVAPESPNDCKKELKEQVRAKLDKLRSAPARNSGAVAEIQRAEFVAKEVCGVQ